MRTDRKVVFPAPLGPITAETLECSNLRGSEAWGGWDWWTCKGSGTPVRAAVTAGGQAVDSFPNHGWPSPAQAPQQGGCPSKPVPAPPAGDP